MKRIALLVAAVILPLTAETLSRGDRDFAMSHLHASRKLFLDAIDGLSEAQWKFKPSPERWSIAEAAEHIALSEDALLGLITEKALKSEPVKDRPRPARADDEKLIVMIRDRSRKGTAPEFLKPSGKWATREALAEDFKKSRERTISFVESTAEDLRSHTTPHPVLQSMDAYQWVLLIAAHTERHTAQINEVKADANFPK
jgi:uncharacterized damage-inducible protein DinB